jgi:aspartate aminotransferase
VADPQHAVEPDGRRLHRGRTAGLADVLLRHPQVHILTDDIYEVLVYDGGSFATIAGVEPKLQRADADHERRVEVARHDRLAHRLLHRAEAELLGAMLKLQSQSTTNPSSIAQWAAVEALNGPQDFLKDWRQVFQDRRDLVVKGLNANTGLDCLTPEGAFYVFPSVKNLLGRTSGGGGRCDRRGFRDGAARRDRRGAGARVGLRPSRAHAAELCGRERSELEDAVSRIQDFCSRVR